MIELFVKLIINQVKHFEDVPDDIKEEVKAELKRKGYGTDGKPLPINQ